MSLYTRYRTGEKEEVWQELRSLDNLVWTEAHYNDAWNVCLAACKTIKSNFETIVKELLDIGYEFCSKSRDGLIIHTAFVPADPKSVELVNWLEEQFGKVGMMVRAYILTVGDINLNGTHSEWDYELLPIDPLVIEFTGNIYGEDIKDVYLSEYEYWQESRELGEKFGLPFAPDFWHKADISGGMSYRVLIPDRTIDPVVMLDHEKTTFVDYLNLNFEQNCFRFLEQSTAANLLSKINSKLEKI
ncbi:MAG: hypothetical protein QNJ63_31985 [Calothrix sp. MO_192.B10]|nr:hypothetical protein [Calothrix sp. MO_192.B10]